MQRLIAGMAAASAGGAVVAERGYILGYTVNEFSALVMAGCAVLGLFISIYMACWRVRHDRDK